MKNNELKNKLLTKEQVDVVKEMIVDSMKGVYLDMGDLPGPAFYVAAEKIADKILKNAQESLIQTNVFVKAVKNSKSLKTKKNK